MNNYSLLVSLFKNRCRRFCVETGRCMTGNVGEFRLVPLFSGRETTFACHVQPLARYKLYDVEYTLVWQGNSVNERRLTAERRVDVHQRHPLKAIDVSVITSRHRFHVSVVQNCFVGSVPARLKRTIKNFTYLLIYLLNRQVKREFI